MLKRFQYNFPTKIFFGVDQVKHLDEVFATVNVKKVLIVYGMKSVIKSGILENVTSQLTKINISVVKYGGCPQNPSNVFVDNGAIFCNKEGVDLILALGGGSVIDASKAIALLSANQPNSGIWGYMTGSLKFTSPALPIAVILTSVGSGSEGNGSFIISNYNESSKLGLSNLSSRPTVAVCDPMLTMSLNHFQTALGCADIVAHLVEQYFCLEHGLHLSDSLIISSLKNVMHHSKLLSINLTDLDSRSNIMLASTFSLSYFLSLGKTLDWSTHKIEHALSGLYPSIPHAAGIACLLPSWIEIASQNQVIMKKLLFLNSELNITDDTNHKKIAKAISNYFREFFQYLKLKTKLLDLIDFDLDIEEVARMALKNGSIGNIFHINLETCNRILKISL